MKKKTTTKLINKSDIMKIIHMRGPIGWLLASLAMWIFGFNKVNKANDRCKHYKGAEFSEHILKEAGISYDLNPQQFDYIPQDGPFIVVANHPIGSADGMILNAVIGTMRTDFKIMANFLLSLIPSLKDSFFSVNPFTEGALSGRSSSLAGIRQAMEHLAAGGSLGLFPAGEVSTYQRPDRKTALSRHTIEDVPWPDSIIKLIRNANVPVVPVYFEAKNSKAFHFVGRIHPMLRTLNLPNELFNKKGQTIPMRIGRPIMPNELAEYPDIAQLGGYLRSRVYAMEVEFNNPNEELTKPPELVTPISLPRDKKAVVKEFDKLRAAGKQLFDVAGYQCFLADAADIPIAMIEIGRRREEAFRATGEGSNNAIDVDKYDEYYKQLILWDAKRKRIAGGYRLGIGSEIFEKYGGVDGFYTSSLFTYSDEFSETLRQTIELGRSYVSLEYQKEALPHAFRARLSEGPAQGSASQEDGFFREVRPFPDASFRQRMAHAHAGEKVYESQRPDSLLQRRSPVQLQSRRPDHPPHQGLPQSRNPRHDQRRHQPHRTRSHPQSLRLFLKELILRREAPSHPLRLTAPAFPQKLREGASLRNEAFDMAYETGS